MVLYNRKQRVLFLGNCQAGAIQHILNLHPELYDQTYIAVHDHIETTQQITDLIQSSDIIITQQIFNNYGAASTENVAKLKKPSAFLVVFPSCYMRLYYFDTSYYIQNKITLKEPHEYHYGVVSQSFLDNQSVDSCLNTIYNQHTHEASHLLNIFNQDMLELESRKNKISTILDGCANTYHIDLVDFIKQYALKCLLFYSINHPTHTLLEYISIKIMDILHMDHALSKNTDVLGSTKCILYGCLSHILEFDISNHKPLLHHKEDTRSIIELYYNVYGQINLQNLISNENSKTGTY